MAFSWVLLALGSCTKENASIQPDSLTAGSIYPIMIGGINYTTGLPPNQTDGNTFIYPAE